MAPRVFPFNQFAYFDLNKTGTVSVIQWLKAFNLTALPVSHQLKPGADMIDKKQTEVATIREKITHRQCAVTLESL